MLLSTPHFDTGTCFVSQAAANALAKFPTTRGLDAILLYHKSLAPGQMSADHLMLRLLAAKTGRAVVSEFAFQSKNVAIRNRATFSVITDAGRTTTVVMLANEAPAWTDSSASESSVSTPAKPVTEVEPRRQN